MAYEEHLLILGNTGKLLSTLDLFYILELDKEWSAFCSVRSLIINALNSASLKELVSNSLNTLVELKIVLIPVIIDLCSNSKGKQVAMDVIDRLFRPTELFPVMSQNWLEANNKLKEELDNFCKKKKVKYVKEEDLKQLAAKIAGEDSSNVSSDDLQSLVLCSSQVALKADRILQQELKVKTSPISFEAKLQKMDIYHELYPVKRLQNVPLKNFNDDLLIKLMQAQKAELIKVVYNCYEDNDPITFMPHVIMNALRKFHPNVPSGLVAKLGDVSLLVSLLTNCMMTKAYMRAQLSVVSQLYRQMVEDIPVQYIPGLRDTISWGIKIQSKPKTRVLYLVIVNGAHLLEKKALNVDCVNERGEPAIDIVFEDEISACLKKYFPKSIAIECSNKFSICITQRIKEIVALFLQKHYNYKTPVYITKKSPIPERRACSLDTKLKKGHGTEFVVLIAYSLACQAQDRMLENLKLRFDTREFPYLFNDSFVSSLNVESS